VDIPSPHRGCLSLWGSVSGDWRTTLLLLLALKAGLSFRDFFFSSWEEVVTGWVWNCGILYMGAWVTGRTSCPRRLPTSVFTTRSLGPSEVCLQHIPVTFISLFSLEIPAGGGKWGGAEHLCLPGGSVYLQRKNGEGVRPAGRPGTLGVRPLTGSVAVADCWRRLRAKTSVAHAAACPTGKGLQSSAEAAQALFGTDGDLVGGDAGP
jgi:hypothetical protein